jgi:4-amino-4-deoxy-L-arabinose transferase-like glycosyltransferase
MSGGKLTSWLFDLTLIFGICLFLFFHGLGAAPFYDKQEAREALVIWEIHHSGNWILPLRNGNEIPAKPPFFHWLGALVSKSVDRIDEFTTRFPSALLGTLGVILTYAAGVALWGRSAGLISAFVLSTTVEWQKSATATRVDMALTFVLLCSFLFFLYLYSTGGGQRKAIIFGFLLGLAMLSKGPLGFVVPCFTVLLFLWMKGDLAFLKQLHPVTVVTVCAIVAGSWYLLALWQGGKEFLFMVIRENVPSLIGEVSGHHHPFWWYIPYLVQFTAPWSLFFPALAVFLYQRRHTLADEGLLYIVVWFATVFIFFSAAAQKRTVYILSAYPALALLFGAWWHKLIKEAPSSKSLWLTRQASYLIAASYLLLSGMLLIQVKGQGLLQYFHAFLDPKDQSEIVKVANVLAQHQLAVLSWSALCGLGGISLILAARKEAWRPVIGLITTLGVASFTFVQSFDTILAKQYTFKPFMKQVDSLVKDAPLFFYTLPDYPVVFYADRHIPRYRPALQTSSSFFYLLLWENEWKKIRQKEGLVLRATSEGADEQNPDRGHLMLVQVKNPEAMTISIQSAL